MQKAVYRSILAAFLSCPVAALLFSVAAATGSNTISGAKQARMGVGKSHAIRKLSAGRSAAARLQLRRSPATQGLPSASVRTSAKRKGSAAKEDSGKGERLATDFLKKHHGLLSVKSDLSDLSSPSVSRGAAGNHVSFQQLCNGVPVEGAKIKVHLFKDGRVQAVKNRLSPRLRPTTKSRTSMDEAIDIASLHLNVTGGLRGPIQAEQVILPDPAPGILVWKVSIAATQPCGDWVVMVHAEEGTVLSATDIRMFASGVGYVYDPNPVVALGTTDLSDQDDAASAVPQEAYFSVILEDLDNTGYLRGPYVDTVLTSSRAYSAELDFCYDRSQPGFEEVMIYYHIQEFQKYLQNDLGVDLGTRQVLADAHLSADDNSWFSPLVRAIYFGDGGVDDGEDAHLILHEYTHAVTYDVLREIARNPEAAAMSEGVADYYAASFFAERDFMPETFAPWDGIARTPVGIRRVDSNKVYPSDMVGESHDDGEIWSSGLWHLRQSIGGEVTDRIVAESLYYLDGSSLFTDGLEALLQADDALYAGDHADAISSSFAARGILVQSSLSLGETREGTLAKGDLTMPDGSYYDQYSFTATEGQIVRINMDSSDFDAYLLLLAPWFNTMAKGDDLAYASTNAQIVLTIPYSGTYHILANAYSQDHTGQYSISLSEGSLSDGNPHSTAIAYGTQVSGYLGGGDFELGDGTYYDEYTFGGHVGQEITVSMTSSSLDAYLVLYDFDHAIIAQDDDSGGGTNARLIYTLPYDGEYILAANQSFRGSGSYGLSLSSSDPQLQFDIIVSGKLEDGDLTMDFDGSFFDPYQFQGAAGEALNLKLYSAHFDPYLILYDPYYQVVAEVDDATGDNLNAILDEFAPTMPGTYFVIANTFGAGDGGVYKLALCPASTTDSDSDGYSDRVELAESTNPLDPSSVPEDTDGDFLPDNMDPDNDNDGMPDLWELAQGFAPLDASDATEDADLDGRSNLAECVADTDPHDPQSFFRVLAVSSQTEGVTLQWNSGEGRYYAVYRSTDVTDWILVETDVPSQDGVTTWTDTGASQRAFFYRVEALLSGR